MRTPSYAATAKAMRRIARRHGPLGVAVPETDDRAERWTGPVERRDPRTYQRQLTVGIYRCPFCSHWTGETSYLCGTCHIHLFPLPPLLSSPS